MVWCCMLTADITKKIVEFVYAKPRTVQEIAEFLGINWRTADAYVEKISVEQGVIAVRTFRPGTRGGLKIVYWNTVEKTSSLLVQDTLFERIKLGRKKADFSPFDIFQYVDDAKRTAVVVTDSRREVMGPLLDSAQKEVLFFSGNVSWSEDSEEGVVLLKRIEQMVNRGIVVKILCRIDLPGIHNIISLQSINSRLGRDVIEIRHCEQPLRGFIVDSSIVRLKEMKKEQDFRKGELKGSVTISYTLQDTEWAEWLAKVFWYMWRNAISFEKRVRDLESIQKLL